MHPMRVVFIVNPAAASGRGQARWVELKPGFLQDNAGAKVLFTAQSGEAVRLAQDAAPSFVLIVSVGGNGTGV